MWLTMFLSKIVHIFLCQFCGHRKLEFGRGQSSHMLICATSDRITSWNMLSCQGKRYCLVYFLFFFDIHCCLSCFVHINISIYHVLCFAHIVLCPFLYSCSIVLCPILYSFCLSYPFFIVIVILFYPLFIFYVLSFLHIHCSIVLCPIHYSCSLFSFSLSYIPQCSGAFS